MRLSKGADTSWDDGRARDEIVPTAVRRGGDYEKDRTAAPSPSFRRDHRDEES